MNIKKLLTKKNLRKWLESKKPQARVGYVDQYIACPIFNFLKENKLEVEEVGGDDAYISSKFVDLPKWTTDFIKKVDELPTSTVSAKKALEILDTL